jgi:hypothetical protein
LVSLLCCLWSAPVEAARKAAVFEFELIDTSLDGEMLGTTEAEKARLAQMAPKLRELLKTDGICEVIDIAPVAEQARNSNLQACGMYDAMMARNLGADLAVTGTVQKVSNLILNVNLHVGDASTNEMLKAGSVDMRGNTDDSWLRGLRYPIRNRMFDKQ